MKETRRYICFMLAIALLSLTSCSNEEEIGARENTVTVSLSAELPQQAMAQTRADGNSGNSAYGALANIDWTKYDIRYTLKVEGENGTDNWQQVEVNPAVITCDDASEAPTTSVRVTSGYNYRFMMWADIVPQGTTADHHYSTVDFPKISINGSTRTTNDETRDAYYAVKESLIPQDYNITLNLQRPFAKLRAVTSDATNDATLPQAVKVEYSGKRYSGIDILTGELTGEATGTATYTSTIDNSYSAGVDATSNTRTLFVDYLFAGSTDNKVGVTLTFYTTDDMTTEIANTTLANVPLQRNTLTTLSGELLGGGTAKWDKESMATPQLVNNQYIINSAEKLAYLQKSDHNLQSGKTFVVTKNIDMCGGTITPLNIPANSTIQGNGKTIKNIVVNGNALLGAVEGFKLSDITIEGVDVTGTGTDGAGVLVASATGTTSISKVTVRDSKVLAPCKVGIIAGALYEGTHTIDGCTIEGGTAETSYSQGISGQCGALVGYAGGATEASQATVNTTISNNTVNATVSSYMQTDKRPFGKLVGSISGYSNNEKIYFINNTASSVTLAPKSDKTGDLAATFQSMYNDSYRSTFCTKALEDANKHLIGGEGYCRGIVCFEGTDTKAINGDRFIPTWDGTRKIQPLEDADKTKLIYSPYDLAWLQGKALTAVSFKEDIDLDGDRTTQKNVFTPISSIKTLDGENHTLYNLNVNVTDWIGGFIGKTDDVTTHKNINFINSSVIVTPTSGSETAYAGTLCAYVEVNYTVENVNVNNSYVNAISKSGMLVGFATSDCSKITCKNSNVTLCTIENKYLHVGGQDFAATGEMGGLIGFIKCNALIQECNVTKTTLNCEKSIARHVNHFIGDIVLEDNSLRVDINKCTATENTGSTNNQHNLYGAAYSANNKSVSTSWFPKYELITGELYVDGVKQEIKNVIFCP